MKYKGPCINCNAFKDQQYILKRCIACYQRFHRYSDEFEPRKKYEGPCIHCASMESKDGRFIRKMCSRCYARWKATGNPKLKEVRKYEGPCITCRSLEPGYAKYFQKKMCSKCYRHFTYINSRVEKGSRHCKDCNQELSIRGWVERCRKCHRKYKWQTDKDYREGRKKSRKKYDSTNKGKRAYRMHTRKRRAILAKVENTLTSKEWQEVLDCFNHRCAYCKSKNLIEMDHIIPISKGGPHTVHNVVPACRSCNASKNDGLPPLPIQSLLL